MVIQALLTSQTLRQKSHHGNGTSLEAKGWLVAGDGSMSVRVGPQAVWVTVAGADKAALTQDMLVRVDMNGKAMLSAKPKPLPEDLPIHLKSIRKTRRPVRDAHLSGLRGCDGDAGPDRAACSIQPRSAGAGTGAAAARPERGRTGTGCQPVVPHR